MGALGKRVRPHATGDHPALMGGVEQEFCVNGIGDFAYFANRMREEIKAATDGDELWSDVSGKLVQLIQINRIAICIDRSGMNLKAIEPGTPSVMVGDMTGDPGWRNNDRIARLTGRHECIEVGQCARRNPDFRTIGPENTCGKFSGDHLDFFNCLQSHFIFSTRIAKRGSLAKPHCQHGCGFGVHDIGGRVEVEALALMNFTVAHDQGIYLICILCGRAGHRCSSDFLNAIFAKGGNPSAACQIGHEIALSRLAHIFRYKIDNGWRAANR